MRQCCKQAQWGPAAAAWTRKSVVTLQDRQHLLHFYFIWEHQTIAIFFFFFLRNTAISPNWDVYFHSVSHLFADFFLQKPVTTCEWGQPKLSVRLTFAWRAWNVIFKPSLSITSIFSLWFNLYHRLQQYFCNAVLRTPHCPSVRRNWIRRSTLRLFTALFRLLNVHHIKNYLAWTTHL